MAREYDLSYKITKKKISLKLVGAVLSLLFILVIVGGVWVMNGRPSVLGEKNNGEEQNEIEKLVNEVSQLMLLPAETPLIATVTDQTKTSEQKFFSNAKVGDKVLVYKAEKKAILYRPDEKRIIEVGFVKDETEQGTPIPNQTPTPTPAPQYDFSYSDNIEFIDETVPSPSPSVTPAP